MQPDSENPVPPELEGEGWPRPVKRIGLAVLIVVVGGTFVYGLIYMVYNVLPALG